MQQKKAIQNPENTVFNIRKLNKKTIGGKNPGECQYYTPEAEHEKQLEFQNYSNPRREKQLMLDQTVNEAIVNSKAYGDLKKTHLENKKKNAEEKSNLSAQIAQKKKEKGDAKQEQEKLEKEKEKYLEAINSMRQKLEALRETNERYRQALSNRMTGEADYISNLIISMRFQAEYEHDIDPDQMTYEELLELEEKIGVVSKGLPKQIISLLPQNQVLEAIDEKCTVCFSNYEQGEIMTQIPNCKHEFHFECLESWLQKEKVCPLCKQEVQLLSAENQAA